MKIGLFTDLHYCDKESISNRRPRLSYNKAQEAMEHFEKNNVDLVVCLGDLVDDCDNKEKNIIEIKKICQMIHSYNIPFFSLMGNHDYQNFTREEFALYSGGAYPPFMYECHNNTLVFLDSNYSSNGEIYVSNNIDWTDAKLPNDQMDALKRILNTKKNIYIFSHQSIDNTVDKYHIIKNSDKIRELIKESGSVKMVIQGHYHVGKDTIIDNIPYHTLKAMCEFDKEYFEILEL